MTTHTDRDRAIDELLRRALTDRVDAGPSPACLDAETLAAWAEGGLSEPELASVEVHVADCVRCQAMLAAVLKASVPSAGPRPWWSRGWTLGWMVPVAAGAAAIALWIAVPGPKAPAPSVSRSVTDSTPALAPDVKTAKTADLERQAENAAPQSAPAAASPRAPAPAPADRSDAAANTQTPAAKDERDERRSTEAPAAADRFFTKIPPQPTVTPPAAQSAAPPQTAALDAASAAARAPQAEVRLRNEKEKEAVASELVGRAREAASAERWRVGSGGTVQRSTDSGATWESLQTGVTTELLAVSSPAATVCWVVGRSGVVLVTTDGRRFVRVSFPASVDLTAILATDARSVVVTTADGRTFRTDNAGMSWTEGR